MQTVKIIMVAHDNPEMTIKAVQSVIFSTTYDGPWGLVLVDNGSDGGQITERVSDVFGGLLAILRVDKNEPLGVAWNKGASRGQDADVYVFLDNDVEVLAFDWLGRGLNTLGKDGTGVVGARLLTPGGMIQHRGIERNCGGFYHPGRGETPDGIMALEERAVDAVTGACFMVRRDLFQDAGGWDIRYNYSYLDVDLCYKIKALGYSVRYCPGMVLTHHEQSSGGRSGGEGRDSRRFHERWREELRC